MYQLLYQDERIVVIDKPAGFHVHPPEISPEKVPRHKIVLYGLRDQIEKRLYPVHRLDAGTSGVLMFALDSMAASTIAQQFARNEVRKTYWAVSRGHSPDEGRIDSPLKSESSDKLQNSLTEFKTLKRIELPISVTGKYPTARYSWLQVQPKTGRYHQIRRHLNRISHPIVGDAQHGDSRHNKFFREQFEIPGLCLRAIELKFQTNWMSEPLLLQSKIPSKWQKISEIFSANPN